MRFRRERGILIIRRAAAVAVLIVAALGTRQARADTASQTVNGYVTSAQTFSRTATSTTDGVYVNVIDINGNINLNNASITLSVNSQDFPLLVISFKESFRCGTP
jgi:hypothetical protein